MKLMICTRLMSLVGIQLLEHGTCGIDPVPAPVPCFRQLLPDMLQDPPQHRLQSLLLALPSRQVLRQRPQVLRHGLDPVLRALRAQRPPQEAYGQRGSQAP